jgi:F0F1-type ATP synthase assembly protein I
VSTQVTETDFYATTARTTDATREQSLGTLVSDATQQVSTLVRKELQLAKAEVAQTAKGAGLGAGLLGAAAFLGLFTFLFFSLALAWLLDSFMPRSLAFLLVGLLFALLAGVFALVAKKKLTGVSGPKRTVQAVKDDLALAKNPTAGTAVARR